MLSFDELSGAQAKGISDIHPYHGKRQSTKRLPRKHKEVHPWGEVEKSVHEASSIHEPHKKSRIPTESGRTRRPCRQPREKVTHQSASFPNCRGTTSYRTSPATPRQGCPSRKSTKILPHNHKEIHPSGEAEAKSTRLQPRWAQKK